jgi:hypothetical protein
MKLSEETKRKISIAMTGKKQSKEQREKHSKFMNGYKYYEESKINMGAKHGKNHHFYGKKLKPEHREKVIKTLYREKGENHFNWKGDNAGIKQIHVWLINNYKRPEMCSACGSITKNIDLANMTGIYARDITHYRWLCRRCHQLSDGRLKNNLFYNKKKGWEPK